MNPAILKINGDALLETHDDGAFINVLKRYFSQLNDPLYPDSDNAKAKSLTVGFVVWRRVSKQYGI
jgi:hypothetical protein